ncbi:uncharacterized protein LOC113362779 [Papaver somniferum]|uniref:uncharacterized protein LOC113362779 n=1 Tax=Papaver somniferum TaxID=3469 RepID=UPI000E6FB225|nr:uncharacterized protein LOC113362779 [Papaver somniferum]XP_026461059.1 uncharacterized protein LOC113362779 [Papaver somniferum]
MMNFLYETSSKMTLAEYKRRNSHSQERSPDMMLGEYMHRQRYGDFAPHVVSEESPLMIYEKYYKHTPLSLEQRLRVLECQKLFADDDEYCSDSLFQTEHIDDPVDDCPDYFPNSIDESTSQDHSPDLEVVSRPLDFQKLPNIGLELCASKVLLDYFASKYTEDLLVPDIVHEAVDTIKVTCTADFEPLSVCISHFANYNDPMPNDIVDALCPPMVNQGNLTTKVISADLEPDLGVTDFYELKPLNACLGHCAEFDDSFPFDNVNSLLPMISSEDIVSTEVISADLEPDLKSMSQIETNIYFMFVVHVSHLIILTKDYILLGTDLHIYWDVLVFAGSYLQLT